MKSPFDPVQAAFYLVAAVIVTHLILVVVGSLTCVYYGSELIKSGKECPSGGRLSEVLGAALAAALAFASGKNRD